MKKLVLPKRIIGVFILICISLVPFFSVDAKSKCEEVLSSDAVNRYGITFEPTNKKEKKFVIKMNPTTDNENLKKKLRKIKFRVKSINSKEVNSSSVLSYNAPLKLDAEWLNSDSGKTMVVSLESTKADIDGDFCKGKGYINFTLSYRKGGEAFYTDVNIDSSELDGFQGALSTKKAIDCNNVKSDDYLAQMFCNAKSQVLMKQPNAKNTNKSINFENVFNGWLKKEDGDYLLKWDKHEKEATFHCDYKSTYSLDQLNGDNYYTAENKSYLYGSGSYQIPFKYTYHYDPIRTEDVKTSCEVECEEAVTVEYGPPIASKAGLCFEYKVKVTSVVNCGMTKPPEKPKKDFSYCTPTPICTNNNGYMGNQGGPNEEFDYCIKNCDGGKYTDKCNAKCYKEVYEKDGTKNMSNSLQILAVEKMAKKKNSVTFKTPALHKSSEFSLESCKAMNGGCYVNNNGSIQWQPAGVPGRWYLTNPHKDLSQYIVGADGIYRHKYADGSICTDTCWWSGCEDATYLNPGFAEKDYENNKNIYKEAMKQCSAAASCTTTTATFTISVDYKHNVKGKKDPVKETIKFPYETDKDKLKSDGTNTLKNKDTTLLDNDGCYKNKRNERWYRAEWSFPGTWIHNKTGEISYSHLDKNSNWQDMRDKFCIPLNALNVNEKWWNYYYNKVLKKPNSTTNPSFSEECGNNSNSITNPSNITESDIDWNIHGKTNKFGFFNWNINVECFYALNSNPANVSTSDDKSKQDKCIINDQKGSNDYKIRPVDLTNLFPATDGGDSNLADPKSTGRTPGFNWSQYANTGNKNLNYTSKPSEYVETVQRLGYKVYNDENLDYQFILTRDILNDMKTTTKVNGKNYTEFNGKTEVKNGVVHYISSAIRSGSELSKADKKVPEKSNIFCNNMKNYSQGCR